MSKIYSVYVIRDNESIIGCGAIGPYYHQQELDNFRFDAQLIRLF